MIDNIVISAVYTTIITILILMGWWASEFIWRGLVRVDNFLSEYKSMYQKCLLIFVFWLFLFIILILAS